MSMNGGPDFSGFLPTVALIIVSLVAGVVGLVHEFWVLPPIAKAFRKAKFSKGPIGLIQDLSGNVVFLFTKKELPEGVIKTNHGWFLLPMPGTRLSDLAESKAYTPPRLTCPECGSTGKHHKGCSKPPREPLKDENEKVVPPRPTDEKELEKYADEYGRMVHVPILRGLGRQIFIGSISSPMLSNIWTIAHADLLQARKLLPMNMQKTQLDALETNSRNEGLEMFGAGILKWFVFAILAAIPIILIVVVIWYLNGLK